MRNELMRQATQEHREFGPQARMRPPFFGQGPLGAATETAFGHVRRFLNAA